MTSASRCPSPWTLHPSPSLTWRSCGARPETTETRIRRPARSQRKLAADFPVSPATVRPLPPEVEDDLDAFLKRYEQLVNATQDELFKVVAIVGGEDISGSRPTGGSGTDGPPRRASFGG